MRVKVSGIRLTYKFGLKESEILAQLLKKLKLSEDSIFTWEILKRSLDARKGELYWVYSLGVDISTPWKIPAKDNSIQLWNPIEYQLPLHKGKSEDRPVIVGSGPAGLFCALVLAETGYKPIVLERGDPVEVRRKKIHQFWESGVLDPQSNVQFGEGGAGTFSDGKLNTGIKDKEGRMEKVLKSLVLAGAPSEILISNKPHIGTDNLEIAVKNLRKKIESLGGEVRFQSRVTTILSDKGKVSGVQTEKGETFTSKSVVLATGHSARDIFEMLNRKEIPMEKKIFAVGLRIEHPQELINRVQYGNSYALQKGIPAADYKLAYKTDQGRGVFSFCMCPGGQVVASASEACGSVTNGMSYFARDRKNANSAILVNVYPEDFKSSYVLEGMEFQRALEKKAFELAGGDYSLPVQRLEDFRLNRVSSAFGSLLPDTGGKTAFADLNKLWPELSSGDSPFASALKEGIIAFDKKIPGFAMADAVLTGVESRSSSPVRILRNEFYQSPALPGLFPCGEGAGYAGGIMSAAVDGIRIAEAVANLFP